MNYLYPNDSQDDTEMTYFRQDQPYQQMHQQQQSHHQPQQQSHHQPQQQSHHQQQMYQQQQPQPMVAPQFPQQLQIPYSSGAIINGQQPGMTQAQQAQVGVDGMLPLEQSYVENILRFNRGKPVTVYQTFEYNPEWPARVFRGVIEEAGRDHLILSNPDTGRHYLLLMVNLDYVEFDEPIEYIPPTLPGFVQSVQGR